MGIWPAVEGFHTRGVQRTNVSAKKVAVTTADRSSPNRQRKVAADKAISPSMKMEREDRRGPKSCIAQVATKMNPMPFPSFMEVVGLLGGARCFALSRSASIGASAPL